MSEKRTFEIYEIRVVDITEYPDKDDPFKREELWERPVHFIYLGILLEEWQNEDGISMWRIATTIDERILYTNIKTRNTVFDIPVGCIVEKTKLGEIEL